MVTPLFAVSKLESLNCKNSPNFRRLKHLQFLTLRSANRYQQKVVYDVFIEDFLRNHKQ